MGTGLTPNTREEMYYSAAVGETPTSSLPEPVTRKEMYLIAIANGSGRGGGFTPTESQLNAMNSGIDSTKVAQIETNKNNILNLETSLSSTSSDEGKVLTADGQGGYGWQSPQSGGGKKYLYQMNLAIQSFSNSNARIRCNLQLISNDPNLYPTGSVNYISYQSLLSDFLKLDKTSGYAQITNISNISIAPNGGNSPFEMVSYVRINLTNNHWFLQTSANEIELMAASTTYGAPNGSVTEI